MRDIRELRYMQSLPLEQKIEMTRQRIQGWYDYWQGNVYVSFSGGKDSTVLLHLVRELYPSVEAVFVDTGLEYTQIRNFVKTFDNVTILRPKMRFDEVISKYGYPLISKEISEHIYYAKRGTKWAIDAMDGINTKGRQSPYKERYKKYKPLIDMPFNISHICCSVMKKAPIDAYAAKQNKKPITAMMAEESRLREDAWAKTGCNGFEAKHPKSMPMAFWTEQDVLQYIYENDIPICSVYGDVVHDDEQLNLDGQWETKFSTTGLRRTGCAFCGFGAHLDKNKMDMTRFEQLKQIDRKKYDYCFSGGEFVDGIWKPNKKGLGMQYVYDRLNEIYGENFVRYK